MPKSGHNCLKTLKVNTIPQFLMEHPVWIMYMVYIDQRNLKKKKKKCLTFFGSDGIRTHHLSYNLSRDRLLHCKYYYTKYAQLVI